MMKMLVDINVPIVDTVPEPQSEEADMICDHCVFGVSPLVLQALSRFIIIDSKFLQLLTLRL